MKTLSKEYFTYYIILGLLLGSIIGSQPINHPLALLTATSKHDERDDCTKRATSMPAVRSAWSASTRAPHALEGRGSRMENVSD